jgi:3-oxoacyl-[acyl-carrier protein] reductase
MDLGLDGKAAIVTGANRGIGMAIAKGLAREGCKVAMCSRDEQSITKAAEEVEEQTSAKAIGIAADVLNAQDASRLVEEAADKLGAIDILINNVGSNVGERELLKSSDEDWVQTFHYNVFQGVRLTRLVVPHMRKRGGGSIVFLSSISGWIPQLAGSSQYGASKAAQIFMAEPLAIELIHDHIRVNVVSPGSIVFDGGSWDLRRINEPEAYAAYERDGFPEGRLGKPGEVADVAVFLASERSRWVNGENIRADGLEQPVPYARPW